MRRLLKWVVCSAGVLALMAGCKTTEENYQKAYEVAKAKRTEGLTAEEIEGFSREEAMPRTVFKGDSIPLKGMYVRRVEGGIDSKALRYNVIVASFKQQFNARSVMQRLREGGYDNAVLLCDASDKYYVGAVTTASLDSAVAAMKHLSEPGVSPVALRPPYPYILQKP